MYEEYVYICIYWYDFSFLQTQDIQENKNDNSDDDLIETISICIYFLTVAC